MSVEIPEPPEAIVIEQHDQERLRKWTEFFEKLNPRIKIYKRGTTDIERFSNLALPIVLKECKVNDDCTLVGWPAPEEVAFVIAINSAFPDSPATLLPRDAYFFCLDGRAFGITYFTWDGDAETHDWAKTHSLKGYTKSAISWEYIQRQVVEKVKDLESRVPDLKVE